MAMEDKDPGQCATRIGFHVQGAGSSMDGCDRHRIDPSWRVCRRAFTFGETERRERCGVFVLPVSLYLGSLYNNFIRNARRCKIPSKGATKEEEGRGR